MSFTFAGQILIEELAAGVTALGYPHDPDLTQPICLYIHGFNTDRPGSLGQMQRLIATAQRQTRVPDLLHTNTWGVMWPGFATVGFKTASWSALTYVLHLSTVREAGRQLAEYLIRLAGPSRCEITLLAHSLGCRLALETMFHLKGRWPRENVPRAILMAAAVPQDLLWAGYPMRGAVEMAESTTVLFSYRDWVHPRSVQAGPDHCA